jgi:ribosomal protein L35
VTGSGKVKRRRRLPRTSLAQDAQAEAAARQAALVDKANERAIKRLLPYA